MVTGYLSLKFSDVGETYSFSAFFADSLAIEMLHSRLILYVTASYNRVTK